MLVIQSQPFSSQSMAIPSGSESLEIIFSFFMFLSGDY
jgi:hypothetical protein